MVSSQRLIELRAKALQLEAQRAERAYWAHIDECKAFAAFELAESFSACAACASLSADRERAFQRASEFPDLAEMEAQKYMREHPLSMAYESR